MDRTVRACALVAAVAVAAAPSATGEAPAELVEAMKADLADRLGIDPSAVVVVRAAAVVWSDGSWGCPEPGMAYTQALVPGYHVILGADGVEYDYRADDHGRFRLCGNPVDGGSGAADG
jgi:hypothetical protein